MRSLKFPKMFNTGSTNVWKASEQHKATIQNLILTLLSDRGSLSSDPYFGLSLKPLTFEQNNYVLKEQIKDLIYTQVALFVPQVHVERKDIDIIQPKNEKGKVYCKVKFINQVDFEPDSVQILLLNTEPENQ